MTSCVGKLGQIQLKNLDQLDVSRLFIFPLQQKALADCSVFGYLLIKPAVHMDVAGDAETSVRLLCSARKATII